MIRCCRIKIYILIILSLIIQTQICIAQSSRKFNKHDVIDAGNGMKIEMLESRGEGADEEWDVIYYTDKRQLGKRKWEKTSVINQLELAAKSIQKNSIRTATINSKNKGLAIPLSTKDTIETLKVQGNKKNENNALSKKEKVKSLPPVPIKTTPKSFKEIAKDPQPFSTNNSTSPKKEIVKEREKKDSTIISTSPNSSEEIILSKIDLRPAIYSLQQCYAIAIQRNVTLKRALNDINSSAIDRKTARASLLPSASYNLGHYFSFGKNIDPVTNNFVFESFSGGYTAVGLQMSLFSGFSRLNTIKQSSFLFQQAEWAKKRIELELLANVTLTYAALLLAKEQAISTRKDIESTTNQLAIVTEKIKVGKLTKYEAYTFNARLNTLHANLILIQNDSTSSAQTLKQLLNFNYKEPVTIESIDTTLLATISSTNVSSGEFIENVLQTHPAIKEAEMAEQSAALGEKIARGSFYPSVTVGGNVASNYNANQTTAAGQKITLGQQINNNLGQNLNLSLRIPIFSQGENVNRVKKEKINIANAQLARKDVENSVITNTLQIINDFNAAKQSYQASKQAMEQNVLSYELYEEKHKLGLISTVEVLTAHDMLNNSILKSIQSKLQLYFQYQLVQLLKL